MDLRQSDKNTEDMIQFDRLMLGIYTMIPGIVKSFDIATNLACVQPALRMKVVIPSGVRYIDPPIIENVPVCLPHSRSAGLYITVPVLAGDECMLIFSQRAIDNFIEFGGLQNFDTPKPFDPSVTSPRHHDMTDAVCIPGIITMANLLPNWSQAAIEIRSKDGSVNVSVSSAGINIVGDVQITGKLTATKEVEGNGIKLSAHNHTDPQGGNTGGPANV
jgi:hypothetical protein